jgi:maltose alpha-D-glucosyltransferase/alpha-amylase
MKDQYWYQQSVFYEVSVQSFFDANGDGIGDLAGLTEKLDYFVHLGVNCLWLIPFFESPMRDGGYDISDYRTVNPNFGSIEYFETLVSEAHKRGLRIITDLVMNHTSDAHPWFQAARKDRHSKYHDYYVWSDTDQKYRDARIIFLDSEKSNWTWNEETQEYYWHRFYFHQPDLNYDNPAVLEEMLEIVDFWLAMGIDGFRVDAVPYLIEREGTNCENLPETHQILKRLRAFVEEKYTGRVLVCEANQWPRDVVKYLGEGDEFQVAFNFPLMPRIFMALKRADSSPIQWAMEQLPAIPENCQWGTFLRNHDELTLEMVTEEERQFMWVEYAEDRRQRLNLGIRRRLTPLLDNDRRKIELAHSLLFSLPGAPFLYYGDELGMGDNIELFDRNGLRTPMQWNEGRNAGFSTASQIVVPIIDTPEYPVSRINAAAAQADPTSTWHTIRRMVKLRKLNPVFSSHNFEWVNCHETRAVVFDRRSAHEGVLALHNLSSERVALTIPGSATSNSPYTDLFTGEVFETGEKGLSIVLTPYQYLWLKYRER